jgi:hypothetical protein
MNDGRLWPLTFDRCFVPDRAFALARPLLLVISVPLWSLRTIALHHRDPAEAEALAGERSWEPIRIGPPLTTTDALLAKDVERNVSINLLVSAQADHSWIARGHRKPKTKRPDCTA